MNNVYNTACTLVSSTATVVAGYGMSAFAGVTATSLLRRMVRKYYSNNESSFENNSKLVIDPVVGLISSTAIATLAAYLNAPLIQAGSLFLGNLCLLGAIGPIDPRTDLVIGILVVDGLMVYTAFEVSSLAIAVLQPEAIDDKVVGSFLTASVSYAPYIIRIMLPKHSMRRLR